MRWILVFIVLYIIPMWVLFTNYKSFKRACIYGCIYITLSTSLVISNIYLSGLKVLQDTIDYEENVALETYIDNNESKDKLEDQVNIQEIETKESKNIDEKENSIEKNNDKKENKDNTIKNKKSNKSADLEKIYAFKKEVYTIEKVALIPMRECLPYTNNLQKSLSNLGQVKEDVIYAKKMCQDIVEIYDRMEVPNLSNDKYTKSLDSARLYVIKTYRLRALAMENAIELIESKNPMYISKITNYLKESDKEINKFKEEINKLKIEIKNN